jgi:hypothetical protein
MTVNVVPVCMRENRARQGDNRKADSEIFELFPTPVWAKRPNWQAYQIFTQPARKSQAIRLFYGFDFA